MVVTDPPPLTVTQGVPPSMLISTVAPVGTVGVVSLKVSFTLPVFLNVLSKTVTLPAVVFDPGGTRMPALADLLV